jgi:hypothetical protein
LAHVAHYVCWCHTLDLVYKDIEKVVPGLADLRELCTKIVRAYKMSQPLRAAYEEAQDESNNSRKRTLKQGVPTRWLSDYYMFERLLDEIEPVMLALTAERPDLLLSDDQVRCHYLIMVFIGLF